MIHHEKLVQLKALEGKAKILQIEKNLLWFERAP
jgi:hypothetical protein